MKNNLSKIIFASTLLVSSVGDIKQSFANDLSEIIKFGVDMKHALQPSEVTKNDSKEEPLEPGCKRIRKDVGTSGIFVRYEVVCDEKTN